MNKPDWYLTPEEFAEIIVDSLEENNYFKRDELAHPVDIEAAFSTTAAAIATAIDHVGKKIHKKNKKAMMEAENLKKYNSIVVTSSPNITVTNSEGEEIDYFANKYGKLAK